MDIKKLWEFPVPSTCINGGVKLYFAGGDATLKFDYYDEEKNDNIFNGGVLFEAAISHRHSSEKFTKFISEAYDTLIEINDSTWVQELKSLSPEWAEYWKIRHYAIYLDSYGLYEFIARDFNVLKINEGAMKEDK